jgi:hypothetical protein
MEGRDKMDRLSPASKRSVEAFEPTTDLRPGSSHERGIGEGIPKHPAIGSRDDPRIEKEHGAAILPRPDEPSESLLQPERGKRDQIAVE